MLLDGARNRRVLIVDDESLVDSAGARTRRALLYCGKARPTSAVALSLIETLVAADARTHRDASFFFYATLYKLHTTNTAVILYYIYISMPFTMLYGTRCSRNFVYGSELGFVLWINFNDRFTMIIIVSTLYFIFQKRKHRQNVFNNGYSRSR